MSLQQSCMAITWMQVQSQLRVEDAAHKEGINMGFVDSLFRFYEIPELDPSLNLSRQDDQAMRALLVQCGPKSAECDLIEHHTAFKRVSEALLTIWRIHSGNPGCGSRAVIVSLV